MTNLDQNEEIIELTEVLDERPGAVGKDRPKGFSPPASEAKTGVGPAPRSEKTWEPRREESQPSSLNLESEMRAMREKLKAAAEEWMAAEGVRILERVAREMFPRIAAGVLRQEIEKLRAGLEEKE
jgi:hypothetical protein